MDSLKHLYGYQFFQSKLKIGEVFNECLKKVSLIEVQVFIAFIFMYFEYKVFAVNLL